MKNVLYLFAVWVMFSNGQIWKYPQAEGWTDGGPPKSYLKHSFILNCSNGTKSVVEIPQYKVRKIGFGMKECWTESYSVFHNPTCFDPDAVPVHSDDWEVYLTPNSIRTERSSEGKTHMLPAHIVHYDSVSEDWK